MSSPGNLERQPWGEKELTWDTVVPAWYQNRIPLQSLWRAIKCDLGPHGDSTQCSWRQHIFWSCFFSVPGEISLIAAKPIPLLATLHRITAGSSVPSLPPCPSIFSSSPTFYGKCTDLQHHGARSIWGASLLMVLMAIFPWQWAGSDCRGQDLTLTATLSLAGVWGCINHCYSHISSLVYM